MSCSAVDWSSISLTEIVNGNFPSTISLGNFSSTKSMVTIYSMGCLSSYQLIYYQILNMCRYGLNYLFHE